MDAWGQLVAKKEALKKRVDEVACSQKLHEQKAEAAKEAAIKLVGTEDPLEIRRHSERLKQISDSQRAYAATLLELAEHATSLMERGEPVPTDILVRMQELAESGGNGFEPRQTSALAKISVC